VKVDFLKAHQNLVLDTSFFLRRISDFLETIFSPTYFWRVCHLWMTKSMCVIVNSELPSIAAFSTTLPRTVKSIYIDPPLTDASAILYKNDFQAFILAEFGRAG